MILITKYYDNGYNFAIFSWHTYWRLFFQTLLLYALPFLNDFIYAKLFLQTKQLAALIVECATELHLNLFISVGKIRVLLSLFYFIIKV